MNNNRSSGGAVVIGIIALIIGLILAFFSKNVTAHSIGRTLLIIGAIFMGLIVLLVAGIIVFAFIANKEDSNDPTKMRSSSRKSSRMLKPEEEQLLVETRRTLGQIRVTLARIRELNIRQAGGTVCKTIDDIVDALKEDPKDISKSRQFLNYYVPTMSNILEKYYKLEKNGMAEQDMKDKVCTHLQDIKLAAEKQYKNLFDDDVLDLTVDMEVMEISCRRDGLLSDVSVGNNESGITLNQ